MRTLEEIKQALKQLDEVVLLELLDLHSDEIVDRCGDLIEDKADKLEEELEQFFPSEEYDSEGTET